MTSRQSWKRNGNDENRTCRRKVSSVDIKHFISLIRKCKNPTEISDTMFNELVDKIVVYEAEGVGKARTQKVDIYFNYVGQVDIAYTEEELAEIEVQKEQEEQQRLARQRKREKAYREKRKAQKIAENGGEIVKTKVCPHCNKEFVPTSNRQVFCSKSAAIKQGKTKRKPTEKQKEEIIITDSVNVLCVAIPIGLHTASRNTAPKNVKRKVTTKNLWSFTTIKEKRRSCNAKIYHRRKNGYPI